jgi:hypothetical protein
VAAGGVARGWDPEFESALLQRRVHCELYSWIARAEDDPGARVEDGRELRATNIPAWRSARPHAREPSKRAGLARQKALIWRVCVLNPATARLQS